MCLSYLSFYLSQRVDELGCSSVSMTHHHHAIPHLEASQTMPLKDLYSLSGDTKFLRQFFFLSKLEMLSRLKSERTPQNKWFSSV